MTVGTSREQKGRQEHDSARALASAEFGANLQKVLIELIELQLQAKQAHWNVIGADFKSIHELLDAVVDTARENADLIAERMRALQTVPDGRSTTVTATTHLPMINAGEVAAREAAATMSGRIATTVRTMRNVHDAIDAEDPSTADLLHAAIDELEKHSWMLAASAR